ncbi:hypothetical protein DFH87_003076 [Clostridium saccharobutylicum]|uniref:Uncharacterized protein n=1 Tax=Clostridium saccharobutylicum DSM 13864 TaxID=1345695 RepID=U5MNU1_CLOSA|nr:hypothetical protein CLSA_c14340 [Clostridium saccharobutylicum DSM 13864]MBA8897766.1 hypothetical protein [Clostridium saccharobutylicum]NOV76509.1 hypothetical protein [Clostridium saccharobutylicum]NOV81053.1 hypothetical protein [Clostridium saccharobutylicum]
MLGVNEMLTIKGVGIITTTCFVFEIADIKIFTYLSRI